MPTLILSTHLRLGQIIHTERKSNLRKETDIKLLNIFTFRELEYLREEEFISYNEQKLNSYATIIASCCFWEAKTV
jgi:hypothetical protein